MKYEFYGQIFEKSSNIKFRENPSSRSRVVPCGRTEKMKLIVHFHNFTNGPKKKLLGRNVGILTVRLKESVITIFGMVNVCVCRKPITFVTIC